MGGSEAWPIIKELTVQLRRSCESGEIQNIYHNMIQLVNSIDIHKWEN